MTKETIYKPSQEIIKDAVISNDEFEDWGDDILDFTQSNPFGNY